MTPHFSAVPAHVRTPATSANLGPGYDALGLALSWHDEVSAQVRDEGLSIEVTGEGAGLARDESHLVIRSMRAAFERLGGQPSGLALRCRNRIPHGRGLGSSAAAIVGGVLLARALTGDGADLLPDTEVFALAVELEGHPDNVAACLFGGLTVAWTHAGRAHALRADVSTPLRPVVLVPPFESSTAVARGLLPERVPHGDAAFGAGRAALLVGLLAGALSATEREPAALLAATEDRLHQPYRAAAMPASAELVQRLRHDGLAAVVSGAGPTVLVLARGDVEVERVQAEAPASWRCAELAVDAEGARVLDAADAPRPGGDTGAARDAADASPGG